MNIFTLIALIVVLTPVTKTSNDESIEECGLIAYVFLVDEGFDPEYFEICEKQAERLNPETLKSDAIVQPQFDKVESQQK